MPKKVIALSLRVDQRFYTALTIVAATNRRSINSEINAMIEKCLPPSLLDYARADIAEVAK